jgi:hypothetical protein
MKLQRTTIITQLSSKVAQAVSLLTCIWGVVWFECGAGTPNILIENSGGFTQSLQANAGIGTPN